MILGYTKLDSYVKRFNELDNETFVSTIDNSKSRDWLSKQIPRLDCPDKELEQTYYFRWWTFRKHIRQTPNGQIITEFLPDVQWAGLYNGISCAAGHHLYEGRWLRDTRPLLEYLDYWYKGGGALHTYSNWVPAGIWKLSQTTGDFNKAVELLPEIVRAHEKWEENNAHPSGLFWSDSNNDGMEFAISGPGLRTTLNCYTQASMRAISSIAGLAGDVELCDLYNEKANRLEVLINKRLWDAKSGFYRCIPLDNRTENVNNWTFDGMDKNKVVRELWGYLPWYFSIADSDRDFAWRELFTDDGFQGECSLSVAERRHPMYGIFYTGDELKAWINSRDDTGHWEMDDRGHECLWNGPSWPYATSQALTALATYLQTSNSPSVTQHEYRKLLSQYAKSHRREREDGVVLPWIDEDQHPDTGDWIARTQLAVWNNGDWDPSKGGVERGKDYNHSTFCDLVISGLFGIRPEAEYIDIHPLFTDANWDYACLDAIPCHGRLLTVMFDRDGTRYNKGSGYKIFIDGVLAESFDHPQNCRIKVAKKNKAKAK